MWQDLVKEDKEQLLSKLQSHLVDGRIELIDSVLKKRTENLCLVLEDLYQEHNASAILRNADAFGVQDIHIIENDNEFQANKEVSMSAHKWLDQHPWAEPNQHNTENCLRHLKSQGFAICATSMREGAITIDELPIDKPIALCFGTELTGLSDTAHEMADHIVYIPMDGFIQSFNVSVASALCMSKLREKMPLQSLSEERTLDLKIDWTLKSVKRWPDFLNYYLNEIANSSQESK